MRNLPHLLLRPELFDVFQPFQSKLGSGAALFPQLAFGPSHTPTFRVLIISPQLVFVNIFMYAIFIFYFIFLFSGMVLWLYFL